LYSVRSIQTVGPCNSDCRVVSGAPKVDNREISGQGFGVFTLGRKRLDQHIALVVSSVTSRLQG